MAVISKPVSASLRLRDLEDKSIVSYSRINPAATPADIVYFTEGISILRGEEVGSQFLTVTTELEEV